MRFIYCLFLLISSVIVVKAQQPVFLQEEIELPKQKYSLQEVFDKLEAHNIITAYSTKNIKVETTLTFPYKKIKVADLLVFLEGNYAIKAQVKSNKIIFTKLKRSYTISGFIREYGSNESLVGATIALGTNKGTFSNAYGFYSLTLPEGEYEMRVSYIGYIHEQRVLNVNRDMKINIGLKVTLEQLSEIEVKSDQSLKSRNEFKHINLEDTNIASVILGADDAIKRLQTISGTGGGVTGFSDLEVRAGSVHENLVLLDGVPVYNYNHFPGILSIFNTKALKSIDFYKGQFPARYAGRLSSVTDIKMKEGNMETYHMGGSFDFATLSIFVEGPILKNKASFIVNGRRSWIDGLSSLGDGDDKFGFHLQDINIKANFIISGIDRVYLSHYSGEDELGEEEEESLSWSNNIIALRWNHIFSDKLFCNTILSISEFNNTAKSAIVSSQENDAIINQYILKERNFSSDFEYYGEWYQLRFGIGLKENSFKLPFKSDFKSNDDITVIQGKTYLENKVKFSSNIYGNIGLNYVLYDFNKMTKHFFQPRINLNYQTHQNSIISISFSEMYQFIHHLGSYSINFPYAFRLPASTTFLPGVSRLYELKYFTQLREQKDVFSMSLYYKEQKNLLQYKPGQDLFNEQLADEWENQVQRGQRKAFGFEMDYAVDLFPLVMNLSYTFTNNQEQFPTINNNQYYRNALTPKHIIILSAAYTFNEKHSVSVLGTYNTGRYMTIPIYEIGSVDDAVNQTDLNNKSYVYGDINGFQLRDNYRFDLGYTFQTNGLKNGKHILKVGVNSVLGKHAPFRATAYIFDGDLTVEEVALPSPMPNFSYTFKF